MELNLVFDANGQNKNQLKDLQKLHNAESQISGWIRSCETEEQLENCGKAIDAIILHGFQNRIPPQELPVVSKRLKQEIGSRLQYLQDHHSRNVPSQI